MLKKIKLRIFLLKAKRGFIFEKRELWSKLILAFKQKKASLFREAFLILND